MRRVVLGVALAGTGVLVARALGPRVGEHCGQACADMFDRMPDEMPPKRILRGIEEIHDQTTRILGLLEERGPEHGSTAT